MAYLVTVIAYLIVLMGVGFAKYGGIKGQDDFMVAGRNVSTLFLVGTLVCTWIGSGSLFGGAGLAFREGLSQLWMSAGAWVGIVLVYFLAHRVRRISQYTVADLLEKRYNPAARLLGTSAVIIAYVSIAGYQFRGGGRLLNLVTANVPGVPEISVEQGRIISCVAVVLFTLLAGMMSIVAVDLFNGALMLLGVILGLPLALTAVGGWPQVAQSLPVTHFSLFGRLGPIWALGVFFPTFFLLLGESSMYQKFMSARDERSARRAVLGMVAGVIAVETCLALLAVVGAGRYFHSAPFRGSDGSLDGAVTETIILYLARHDLPVVAGCLLIGAGMAIIFSTANTFLMIPATNLTRDLYQRFIHPEATQQTIVRFQRAMIVLLGFAAYLLATQFKKILDMAFYAYTMVGAGLTPALLAAFLWKRVTPAGGVASIAAGILGTILFGILQAPLHLEFDYIIYPAAIASLLCLVVVSLLTKPSPEEKYRPFMDTGSF